MPDHYYSQDPSSAHRYNELVYQTSAGTLTLRTDAGVFSRERVDFGSDLLIRSLPPLTGRVLDIGCGYGAIGLSIALNNPEADVVLSDINGRAVELCAHNAKINGLGRVTVLQGDGFEHAGGFFDSIVCNPPIRAGKQVVYGIFDQARGRLSPGGALYVVVQNKQGAESAEAYLRSRYARCGAIARKAGYRVIRCEKA